MATTAAKTPIRYKRSTLSSVISTGGVSKGLAMDSES